MQIPPLIELEDAAKKLVRAAKKKGTLKELTPRLIRQTIEKQLGLEEASLDASEYKSAIKSATKSALDEDPASEAEEEEILKLPVQKVSRKRKSDIKYEEEDQPTPKSKGKSTATTLKDNLKDDDEGSAKKKRKTIKAKNEESEHDEGENGDSEEASPTRTKKRKKRRMDTKQFKSLEHVPTSDMEQDEPGIIDIAGPSVTKTGSPKKEKKGSPLQKKAVRSKPSIETQNPESKPTVSQPSELPMVVGRDVSSELSELDDPTPKRKAKVANKEPKMTKTKGKEKEKKSAKSSTTLTKDEETIKRLKSLILACGVRKVWSKVFQDLDSPNQQVKKLKEILADLGMTGRMSMDQAKTIKRKRELAQELEDVQQFEKAVLSRSSRSRSQTTAKVGAVKEDDSEKDSEDDDEDEDGAPKRRPTNARKSIMAFLQDQSDEE